MTARYVNKLGLKYDFVNMYLVLLVVLVRNNKICAGAVVRFIVNARVVNSITIKGNC